jgi:hypothetical protein
MVETKNYYSEFWWGSLLEIIHLYFKKRWDVAFKLHINQLLIILAVDGNGPVYNFLVR